MAKIIKKAAVGRSSGNTVLFFNPDNVVREVGGERVIFWEDIASNLMDAKTFADNYRPKFKSEDEMPADFEYLWANGIVRVSLGRPDAILRFFYENDPFVKAMQKEYDAAPADEKPNVHFKLSDVGLDREGALEDELAATKDELAAMRAELEKLKAEKARKAKAVAADANPDTIQTEIQ